MRERSFSEMIESGFWRLTINAIASLATLNSFGKNFFSSRPAFSASVSRRVETVSRTLSFSSRLIASTSLA